MSYNSQFEKLEVWKKAHNLTLEVYKIVKAFPSYEQFTLADQLRRATSSIPTNIVEGNERKTKKEYIQFLYTAKASAAESKYHLILAKDLGYIEEDYLSQLGSQLDDISRMISGLISYLRSKI